MATRTITVEATYDDAAFISAAAMADYHASWIAGEFGLRRALVQVVEDGALPATESNPRGRGVVAHAEVTR